MVEFVFCCHNNNFKRQNERIILHKHYIFINHTKNMRLKLIKEEFVYQINKNSKQLFLLCKAFNEPFIIIVVFQLL